MTFSKSTEFYSHYNSDFSNHKNNPAQEQIQFTSGWQFIVNPHSQLQPQATMDLCFPSS